MSGERTQNAGPKARVAVEGSERPRVLVVAGYDQSGGAGVLSDVKTLEAHGVYGYAICTGFTFQNEREISRIQWFSIEEISEQIALCFATGAFDWVKMGITADTGMAGEIVDQLRRHHPGVRVVWDPVIRASSGREFWKEVGEEWKAVAARCYLLTPNWDEIGRLYSGEDILEGCGELTRQTGCNIYLKGGHHPESPGRDYLWSDGKMQVLEPEAGGGQVYAKHGSGCVLSSSLAANLALGYPLPVAAVRSKQYTRRFLSSNKTLLGWHRPLESKME
jgi:hydroxymethylpyrimidine/phosphomethylpyrimidine kinase